MKQKRQPRKADPVADIESPARIRPGHVQDRTLSVVAGKAKGWSNLEESPIALAFIEWGLSSRHENYSPKFNGKARWEAICAYDEIHHAANPSGRDSTDLDIVSGGGGFPISESRSDGIKKLIAVKSWMAEKDRVIIQRLMEGYSLAGAVKAACNDQFKFSVRARVRDALDSLIQALESARRNDWRFTMRRDV